MLNFRRAGKSKAVAADAIATPAYASPAYGAQPRAADMTVGDYANGVPHIRIGAMFGSLIRQFIWIVPLFALGCVGAWFLTSDFKRTYTGAGTIMVQLGDEYVYQPIAGTQGQGGLMQTPDTITLNELAIIKNPEVMDAVLAQIAEAPGGLAAFDPIIAAKMARFPESSPGYRAAYMELRRKMDRSYGVSTRPRSSIIDLSFKHSDPDMAVTTVNALMSAYKDYRRDLFVDGTSELVTERRKDTEAQLRANEQRMARYLQNNQISDFDSEQTGASKRTEDLRAALNTLRGNIVATESSLATVENQLRITPETMNLYVDDRISNRIAQADLELKQLMAKYLPNSDPVQQKQRELTELRSLQSSSNGQATGGRRVGPNPNHQELMSRRNTLQASADSLREQEITMQRQLDASDQKLRKMRALMPGYNDLMRERETLELRLRTYLTNEQEALLNLHQAEATSENVRVISRATYPIKGRNMRMLAFVGISAAWGFTLFMLALFKVFLDPKLYSAPTAQASSRQSQPHGYAGAMQTIDPYARRAPMTNQAASHMPQEYIPQDYVPQAEVYPDYAPIQQAYVSPDYPAQPYDQSAGAQTWGEDPAAPFNPYQNQASR